MSTMYISYISTRAPTKTENDAEIQSDKLSGGKKSSYRLNETCISLKKFYHWEE